MAGLSDDEIARRIRRFYEPATATELAGLSRTWRRGYRPGSEYPEAPRYPPGFIALLVSRAQVRRRY